LRYRQIPHTGLRPSVLCLGTVVLGWKLSQQESNQLLDAFLDLGGSFIDTAHIYADWAAGIKSSSERTIGNWLTRRGCRDRIILATKGGHPDVGASCPRLSPEQIQQDLTESLEFLQTDYIDLYWLHRDDPARPVNEILDVLESERRQGRIRAYGCSNWRPERIEAAQAYAGESGCLGFAADQPWWNMAAPNRESITDQTLVVMDDELFEFHSRTGLAVVPYSSQAKGFFAGKYGRGILNPDTPSARHVIDTYYNEINFERLERARNLGQQLGRSANEIALAFLLSQEFPVFPIVGCRTIEQLQESCKAADLVLTKEQMQVLDVSQVSPQK